MHLLLAAVFVVLVVWWIGRKAGLWAYLRHLQLLYEYSHQTRVPEAVIRDREDKSFTIRPVPGPGRKWVLVETGEIVTSDKIRTISTGRILSGHSAF